MLVGSSWDLMDRAFIADQLQLVKLVANIPLDTLPSVSMLVQESPQATNRAASVDVGLDPVQDVADPVKYPTSVIGRECTGIVPFAASQVHP